MDISYCRIRYEIHHGGKFKSDNQYIGGTFESDDDIDIERITFEELESFVKNMGYYSAIKYAFRDVNGLEKYYFFHDERSLYGTLNLHFAMPFNCLKVYIEALTADLTENECYVDIGNEVCGKDKYEHLGFESEASYDLGDSDFSSEDEEFIEARKKLRNDRDSAREIEGVNLLNPQATSLGFFCHTEYDAEGNQTEYENSDTSEASLDSDEDAEFIIRKKVRVPKVYSKNCDHQSLTFEIGMRFNDCNECKEAVRLSAILNGHNIKWKKSGGGKLEAVCEPGCPWRLYASKLNGEPTCVIKTLKSEHKCFRAFRNRQANSEWLANVILPALKINPRYGINDIIRDVQLTYGIIVDDQKCYRSRTEALEKLRGTYESHYSKLRSYVKHLMDMDKAGRFELKTYLDKNDRPVFQRIYIGFSVLKTGFMVGCRRAIGFDACFLKTILGGAILAGVAKDCNNKMYPIAWAVVEKENEETWTWFFERLFEELNIHDGFGYTFMSDKQYGLINGIQKLAPNAEHRHCARHIYANWKKKFSGPKYKALFWEAVKSSYLRKFEDKMTLLKAESISAYEEFYARQPRAFCKSLVSLHSKTDIVDNNICETFNSYILKFRDKPIIEMLEGIRLSLMTRQFDIVKSLHSSVDVLCPNIRKKIERIQSLVKFCNLRPALGGKYEVHMDGDSYIINLGSKECSCRWWMLTGIPCCHALACIFHSRDDLVRYVDVFYHRSNCIATYNNHALTPSNGPNDWEYVPGPPILPPEYVKLPGRPKKNRKKDPTEEPKSGRKKWTKAGVKMSCHKCGQFGHNTRTCKEEVPTIPLKPKGKRGRPKKGVQSSVRQTSVHGNGAGNVYFRGPRQVNRKNVSPAQIQEICQRFQVDEKSCTPPPASQ